MLARPVARHVVRAQPRRQHLGHARRGIEIVELQTQAAHLVAHLVELRGVVEVHQHQAAVVFVHVHLEDADHGEALETRQDAGGRGQRLRNDQRHLRTDRQIEFPRERAADHDAEFPGLERLEATVDHAAAEFRHLFLLGGQDAARHHPAHALAARHHALTGDVRRAPFHVRILDALGHRPPIMQRAGGFGDRDMRNHAEDAAAQLLAKAVHDRQGGDERGDAERDAEDRDKRDDGNEVTVFARARVAQTDE